MLKFVLLTLSGVLLTFGVFSNRQVITISGSLVYITSILLDLIKLGQTAKKQIKATKSPLDKPTLFQKLLKLLEGCILLSGLILLIANENKGSSTAGIIIWLGSIVAYFLSGIIVESILKLPLEFGYGGWRIRRTKTKKW